MTYAYSVYSLRENAIAQNGTILVMWTTKRRNEAVRLFGKRTLLVALFVVVIFAASGVWKIAQKEEESAILRAQAERELAQLQERATQLEGEIRGLESARGVEQALREQYSLAAAGESLIVIVDPATSAPVEQPPAGVLERIKKALFR